MWLATHLAGTESGAWRSHRPLLGRSLIPTFLFAEDQTIQLNAALAAAAPGPADRGPALSGFNDRALQSAHESSDDGFDPTVLQSLIASVAESQPRECVAPCSDDDITAALLDICEAFTEAVEDATLNVSCTAMAGPPGGTANGSSLGAATTTPRIATQVSLTEPVDLNGGTTHAGEMACKPSERSSLRSGIWERGIALGTPAPAVHFIRGHEPC